MPTIKVKVREKIAENITPEIVMVCDNSDYLVEFDFDTEWTESRKTAIFVWNGGSEEVGFDGNVCPAPAIKNSTNCTVGVEMGEIRTTTPAYIVCKKSIRDIQQSEFRQSGGEAFLTDYQKKADNRLNTSDKTIVGAINEVNAKAGQSSGGGGLSEEQVQEIVKETLPDWVEQDEKPTYTYEEITEKPDLVEDIGSSLAEETNVLTIELKDKSGKVIASTEVAIPKGEVPDLTDYVKKTDYASYQKAGVVRTSNTLGTHASTADGTLELIKASNDDILAKGSGYKPIVPNTLDYAVKVGMTTNTETWTDEEKKSARDLIGAVGSTDYASPTKAGVSFVKGGDTGISIRSSDGTLQVEYASKNDILYKNRYRQPITPIHLDHAVKVGITTNTETLTDEEKTSAMAWLGITEIIAELVARIEALENK